MADLEKKTYRVLSRIDADKRYEAGGKIDLTDEEAGPLLATQGPCIELDTDTPAGIGEGARTDSTAVPDKPVEQMTLPELKAYAKAKGIAFAGNAGEAKMRELIAAASAPAPVVADTPAGIGEGAQQ